MEGEFLSKFLVIMLCIFEMKLQALPSLTRLLFQLSSTFQARTEYFLPEKKQPSCTKFEICISTLRFWKGFSEETFAGEDLMCLVKTAVL